MDLEQLEQVEKLNELKEKGILTQEEFDEKKKELLNGSNAAKTEKAAAPTDGTADFSHLDLIKGAFNAFISSFKRWNDFKGRTSRFDYFGASLFLYVTLTVSNIVLYALFRGNIDAFILIQSVLSLVVCWIHLTLSVRRLHDINKSGWWIPTIVVPLVCQFFKGDVEANRFGSAVATDEKKANGALALALVYSIIVDPLLVGAFGFDISSFVAKSVQSIQSAQSIAAKYSSFKATKTTEQVQTMVTGIRTLFAGQRTYAGLNGLTAYTMGILTDETWNSANKKGVNPYGGEIIFDTPNNQKYFSITYNGLPQKACVEVASADYGDRSSGLVSIAINPHLSQNYVFTSAVSKQSAEQACRSSNNTIVWTHR